MQNSIQPDHIILGAAYEDRLGPALRRLGYSIIAVPSNPNLSPALADHVDLSVLLIKNVLFLAPFLAETKALAECSTWGYELRTMPDNQTEKYPNDVQLNAYITNKNAIYNPNTVCSEVISFLHSMGYHDIPVRQGYTNCSICTVDDQSLITADPGICKALSGTDYHVLKIEQGHILLPGYDYGFIGGSTLKLSEKLLAFSGILDEHPDKTAILAFLAEKEIEPVFLTDEPLFDFGGGVVLHNRNDK